MAEQDADERKILTTIISFQNRQEKNAPFYCFFSFELDDDNYRIEPERIYMAAESKTGIRSINKISYFLLDKYKGKFSIKFPIPQEGIRVIDTMGLVFLTKIRNREVYYIKLFGRKDDFTNDFYYEQLTKEEYEDELNKYDNSYKNSTNTKYELWGFYGKVVYADF